MTYSSNIRFTYREDTFTESHTIQRYPLGFLAPVENPDSDYETIYMYIQADDEGCSAYEPYNVRGFFIAPPPNRSIQNAKCVCPQFDIGPNEYGFALYKGAGKGTVKSADGALAFAYFKIDASEPTLLLDDGIQLHNKSFGFLLEPISATTAVIDICLFGKEGQIG